MLNANSLYIEVCESWLKIVMHLSWYVSDDFVSQLVRPRKTGKLIGITCNHFSYIEPNQECDRNYVGKPKNRVIV